MSVRLDTGRIDRRSRARCRRPDCARAADTRRWSASTDTAPPEVFALEDGGLRKLTRHNDAVMEELALGSVEDISFPEPRRHDHPRAHGQAARSFVPGKLIRRCYGSMAAPTGKTPTGCPVDTYPLQLERQWFAAHGYVVLAVNYRGSSGRGAAFAERHPRRLGRQGSGGSARVRRLTRFARRSPTRIGSGRRVELRRHSDGLSHSLRPPLQGGDRGRGQRQPALDVRERRVHHAIQRRARSALGVDGPMAQGLVSLLSRRAHQDADAVPGRR